MLPLHAVGTFALAYMPALGGRGTSPGASYSGGSLIACGTASSSSEGLAGTNLGYYAGIFRQIS